VPTHSPTAHELLALQKKAFWALGIEGENVENHPDPQFGRPTTASITKTGANVLKNRSKSSHRTATAVASISFYM
jgi:hypothetical protein